MAAGDVVNGILIGGGLKFFRPAAGVEVMITLMAGDNVASNFLIYDGVNQSIITQASYAPTKINADPQNMKFPINNTTYMAFGPSALNFGYAGIQLK